MSIRKHGFLIASILTSVATVQAVVIDDFTDGSILLQATNYNPPNVATYQTNLNPSAVIGGERSVYASTQETSRTEIDSLRGVWSFEATQGVGYFTLGYGTMNPLAVDLRADGNDAFLLSFTDVYTPGSLGSPPLLRVGGVAYSLRSDLLGISGGAVVVRIPFSSFSEEAPFAPDTIQFEGRRIAQSYRFVLDSIITVPEPNAGLLLISGPLLIWILRKPNQTVETTRLRLASDSDG
jgi:hypothetical protein